MKVALHGTETATSNNAAALLIEHDIAELIARIEALRLPADNRSTMLRVGTLELDLIERTVRRDGRAIALLPKEFRLLEYMMRHQDQVLTREMLLREVWGYKFMPKTNLVDVHMGRLRRKIDGPGERPMIKTIHGAGFILLADPVKARAESRS
jgi:two-component system OmpR family response regulator